MLRRALAVVSLTALCIGPHPGAAADLKPLTLDALRALVTVREPQIAPDATRVVYVRGVGDFKADVEKTDLVLVDVATRTRHVLTQNREGISHPAWSPDGTRIAFLAAPAKDEPAQIFVLSLAGGDAKQVTHARGAIAGLAWRPDGGGLAYLAQEPPPGAGAEPSASPSAAPSPGAAPSARPSPSPKPTPKGYVEPFFVTDEHYLTRSAPRPTHLWLVDADGANPRRLTQGAQSYDGDIAWTPDAKSIVVDERPDAVFAHLTKSHAVVVDVASGNERELHPGSVDTGVVLSRDGTRAAVRVPRHGSVYLQNDVVARRLSDGADVRNAADVDRNVDWDDWLDDRTMLVGVNDGIRSFVWRVPLAGGAPAPIDLGDVDFSGDATVARDGTMAFVGRRADRPPEIYVVRRNAAAVAISDENPWIAGYAVARSERVDWTSDGLPVNGVLTYPVGYAPGKRYPLVLFIHGGPVGTSTRDFSTIVQMLAAHGKLVLQPNYRGSDNSGDAFLQAIVGDVASGPGRDNLAGVEAVKKLGIVDATRIGVSGWSGGGLQTSWLIGHATFWRAALSGAAVDDWIEQATLADINEEFARVFLGGDSPWTAQGRTHYLAESPITYAANVRTPTLILTDSMDQRVPITQSFAFYRALQGRGVNVKLMEFPRAGHNPADPVAREARIRIWTDWFDAMMK